MAGLFGFPYTQFAADYNTTNLCPHVLPDQESNDGQCQQEPGQKGPDEGRIALPVLRLFFFGGGGWSKMMEGG